MPDSANSPTVNYTSSRSDAPTGGDLLKNVIDITTHRQTSPQARPEETIDPAKLYEYFFPEENKFVVDVPLGLISKELAVSLQRFRQAVQESDELERENHVSLAWSNLFGLAHFSGTWPTFDEALAILFAAFESHRTSLYRAKELVALQKVLEILRRTPAPTDEQIVIIYDSLDGSDFDLNSALSAVDLGENADEA